MRHPLADQPGVLLVQVTYFNDLFWDCGGTPTRVIEHGVADPGLRYTGRLPRLAFVVNEPVRRWRVTGTDLLTRFADFDVDAFGIDCRTSCLRHWPAATSWSLPETSAPTRCTTPWPSAGSTFT